MSRTVGATVAVRSSGKWLWGLAAAAGVLVAITIALSPRYLWRRVSPLTTNNPATASELFRTAAEHDLLFSWTRAPILKAVHPSGGALYYFGSCHTRNAHHPMIEKFSSDWADFKPTLALVEQRMGLYFGGMTSAVSKFGESAAVSELGRRDDVATYTLHQEQTSHAAELAAKVGRREAAAYLALRMAHGENPQGPIGEAELEHGLEKRAVGVLSAAFTDAADFDLFWAETYADELGNWRTLRWASIGPRLGHTKLEAVGHWDTVLRDVHMTRILVDQLENGERVFAVVGRSHVIQQEPALRALLPDAEFSLEHFEHVPCESP